MMSFDLLRTLRCAAGAIAMLSCLTGCGGGGTSTLAATDPTTVPVPAIGAGRVDHVSIDSTALHKSMDVEVYLPQGYSAARRYPVLYMFYGYGGNANTFFGGFLTMNLTADKLIASGRIPPMIIVVPDYANSFGVNTTVEQQPNSGGGTIGPYEDYLIGEVVPYIDAHYSSDARRETRYAGGFSMGGFAALYLGLRHPDMFGKIGAHSAALWDYGKTNADLFTGQRDWLYATPALREQRDPMQLALQVDLSTIRFYLDAGTSDLLLPKDSEMVDILHSRSATVEWHASSGGHDQSYWSSQLENYLLFYGLP
jgi:enterochelin esterase-like enzyme